MSTPDTPTPAEPTPAELGRGDRTSAWHFAPCFGTWQGLINPVLVSVPTVLLKSLGFSNAVVGYATLATLPMALKFLLGPMIDANRTRRWWCVNAGGWIMLCLLVLAVPLIMPEFSLWLYLGALFLLAIVKSIHQVALNGFFTLSLTKPEQALFSGLDPMWGRAASIFSGSVLLAVAGGIGERYGDPRLTWGFYFAGLIAVFLPLYFYTRKAFPTPHRDRLANPSPNVAAVAFWPMLKGYVALPALIPGLAYLFFMRSGETVLAKMGVAFLMDRPEVGGYGMSIAEVGFYTGIMTACGITGGAIAGVLLRNYGLRRVVWPFSLAAVVPNLIYVYLAMTNHTRGSLIDWDLSLIGLGVWKLDYALLALLGVENFGFGLGFTLMNFYMFRMAAGSKYPASYVALNASVIYASYLLFGVLSGVLQEWLGYPMLFVASIVVSLPAFLTIPFLNYALDRKT